MPIFFLLLFSMPAWAVRLTGNPEVIRCSKAFLDDALPKLTGAPSRDIQAYIGRMDRLKTGLKQNGLSETDAGVILDLIIGTLKRHPEDPILANLRERLDSIPRTSKMLALCILKGECRLQPREALLLMSATESFSLANLQKQNIGEGGGWVQLDHKDEPHRPRIVVMNPLPKDAVMQFYWAALLIQQLTHYADLELVQDWLQAGKTLQKMKQPVDEYFERYVVLLPQVGLRKDYPVVDEGFYHVLMAARSYYARDFLPKDKFSDLFAEFVKASQTEALRILKEDISSTAHILERFQLTERNLYDFGLHTGAVLHETILRANSKSKAE